MAELVTLNSFLYANGRKAWEPGRVDCCMVLADWAVWLGWSDPAESLRGTYDDEDGFRRIVELAGGVLGVVSPLVVRIQGRLVDTPEVGSIGVIGSRTNVHRQYGAIHTGSSWMMRSKSGWVSMAARPIAVWVI